MPHDTNPADELLHLEEKQFTVGLTEEEEARLAALSTPGPAEGGFDVAAAAAGVLAEVAPAGPWTAADYGWDADDANAVAWAAYYSELGWDPATVQAHLAAEAAAAGEAEPADPAAEPLAAGAHDPAAEPEPPATALLDAAPEHDPAAALDAAAPLDAAALVEPAPLDALPAAALDPWDVAAADAAPWSPAEAPEADDHAPAPFEAIAAPPPLDLADPEPEPASPAVTPASAWDAPAPAASYAPEGEEVPAPVAAAGGTQVWDLSAVQAALAGAPPAAGETGAAPVELLPTIDDGPDAAAAEVPDFRHDVPPGWPGEPADAALQSDFELAGAGSFDPASTAALPGMDAVPPPLPELAPEAAGATGPHAVEALAADDFEIDLEGDDDAPPEPAAAAADLAPGEAELAPLQEELAPVEAVLASEDPDRLAALDLSAPFLGEPEPEPELEAPKGDPALGGVDWAAAHAVPAGDPAVDLATFDAEPDAAAEEDAFAPLSEHAPAPALDDAFAAPADDVLPVRADATRLWALGDAPPAPAPRSASTPLPALEDEPDPVPGASDSGAVPLASAADFLAAAAAAAPAGASGAAEAQPEPEILEVGDEDVLEVVPDDVEPEPAVELLAEPAPAAAPAFALEALFGTDELHEAPAFPGAAPAAALVPAPPPPAAAPPTAPEPAPLPAAAAPSASAVPSVEEPAPGEPDPWDLALAPPQPAAPPTASPAFVPGVHRVVVHTAEGQVKRGILTDVALDAAEVLLAPQTGGEPEALAAERIRAIFFMLPTGEAPPQPEGKRVRVTFRDGRQVAGFSPDYHPERVGFFMIPADTRTHTARIWVYRASVRQVSVT